MRNKNLFAIVFALMVTLALTLACNALNTTPGASNFYMATDEQGENKTNVFSPSDDFFVFFNVSGIAAGTNFEARWYALDLEGEDPNVPFQTVEYAYEEGITSVYFQMTNDSDWPTGNYKVEVYMEGTKVGEQTFSVQ